VTTFVQGIPLPPDDLMIAVANHANHEDFARSRINGPAQMLADLSEAGVDPEKLDDLLGGRYGALSCVCMDVITTPPWFRGATFTFPTLMFGKT